MSVEIEWIFFFFFFFFSFFFKLEVFLLPAFLGSFFIFIIIQISFAFLILSLWLFGSFFSHFHLDFFFHVASRQVQPNWLY